MIKTNKNQGWLVLFLLMPLLWACAENDLGGSEAGNSPSRPMQGRVPADDAGVCLADTIIATAGEDDSVEAAIENGCSFSIELDVDKPYTVTFERDGSFVAAMQFQNSSDSLPTPYVVLSSGSEPVDVGLISFANGLAIPETEPSTQTDLDGDGENDFADTDDDNDDTSDLEDVDCDLDGIIDLIDTNTESCSGEEETGEEAITEEVLQVSPVNLAGIDVGIPAVSINTQIEARFSCPVNFSSVNGSRFVITDETDNTVGCAFTPESGDTIVSCTPSSPLGLLTTYTANLSGLLCQSGNSIASASWSFRTSLLGL